MRNPVYKFLPEKRAITRLSLSGAADWDHVDTFHAEGLVIPDVDGLSSDEEQGQGEMK